jgi:hypothetical protein
MRRTLHTAIAGSPLLLAVAILLFAILASTRASAIERNFAGSAQLDYFLVPAEPSAPGPRTTFDGFTAEVALKLAVDISDHLSANVKMCHGCHGFELPMAYFDYRVRDELNFRIGRFSPSFGAFNVRHDPANHATSSKPLPYDMGRMLRMNEWNLGVIPSPFPDNGIEIGGTHWFGDKAQLDYAVYAVSGFKADEGQPDIEWSHSTSQFGQLNDNNGRPAGGARWALTLKLGEANDITGGASAMYGTYDPANRLAYFIGGVDLAARLGRTQIRFEYLMRRQSFLNDGSMMTPPMMTGWKEPIAVGEIQVFDKHGAYLEIERAMSDALTLVARADGLYRVGNEPTSIALPTRAAIFRYTGGATLAVIPGWRVKASAELWAFSDNPPIHQELELALHLALVGTF